MFSSRVPLPALLAWCRALRFGLHAGLSPVKVFRQQAKSGPAAARPLAGQLADSLKAGESMGDSLKEHRAKFPRLFVELVEVAESAGKLAEVFEELERYFEAQLDARKQFLRALLWPAVNYFAAVGVIAIMVLVLGLLGGAFAPLGKTLLGPGGAAIVLGVGFGFAGVVAFLYMVGRDNEALKQKVEAVGIKIPGLKGAYRSFALQRFSMALGMTHEAGMRSDKAVFSSFQATANDAYLKHAEPTATMVRGGKPIAKALTAVGGELFPDEFLDQVHIGESTGQLSEVMGRTADQYRDEAIRRTKTLAMVLSGVAYALVALMLIALIFSIVMSIAGVYQDAMKGL